MTKILVVGCASLDVLHIAGRTFHAIGGAGLYTALAAARAGADATLLALRPDPLPEAFSPLLSFVRWIGPRASPDEMPRLEIAHHGGGQATLLAAAWGAESRLTLEWLEADLSRYDVIHIAALSSAQKQLNFLKACRERGARCISAGTYARIVRGETETVRALFEQADRFFVNENEAAALSGSGDLTDLMYLPSLYFVTLGARGVHVLVNGQSTHVAGIEANEVDPTGAGDTFCGAALAELARGSDPVAAAKAGVRLAASVVEGIGPAKLLPSA